MHVSLHLNQYGYTSSCITTWVHVSLHYKQYWCMCPCIKSNLGHVFLHQKHTGYTRSCFTVWVHVLLDHKQSGYTRSYVTIWAHVLLHLTIWEHMLLHQNNLDNKQIRVPVTLHVKKTVWYTFLCITSSLDIRVFASERAWVLLFVLPASVRRRNFRKERENRESRFWHFQIT